MYSTLIESETLAEVDGWTVVLELHDDDDSSPDDAECYDDDDIGAYGSQWQYVGVVVKLRHDGADVDHASLWGVEAGWLNGRNIGPTVDGHPVEDLTVELFADVSTTQRRDYFAHPETVAPLTELRAEVDAWVRPLTLPARMKSAARILAEDPMSTFNSLAELKSAATAAGSHFFDPDTMRFFRSRIVPTVVPTVDGCVFVTSEQSPWGDRAWTVRHAHMSSDPWRGGSSTAPRLTIDTVGEFGGHDTSGSAGSAAAEFAETIDAAASTRFYRPMVELLPGVLFRFSLAEDSPTYRVGMNGVFYYVTNDVDPAGVMGDVMVHAAEPAPEPEPTTPDDDDDDTSDNVEPWDRDGCAWWCRAYGGCGSCERGQFAPIGEHVNCGRVATLSTRDDVAAEFVGIVPMTNRAWICPDHGPVNSRYVTPREHVYGDDSPDTIGPVWAVWHGGCSYGASSWVDDVAEFDTLADVLAEHDGAYRGRGFTGKGAPYSGDTPAVDGSATTMVFLSDPREASDPYPDWEVTATDRDTGDVDYDADGRPLWRLNRC